MRNTLSRLIMVIILCAARQHARSVSCLSVMLFFGNATFLTHERGRPSVQARSQYKTGAPMEPSGPYEVGQSATTMAISKKFEAQGRNNGMTWTIMRTRTSKAVPCLVARVRI